MSIIITSRKEGGMDKKSMTGLMDSLIKADLGSKEEKTGSYAPKSAKRIAEQVQAEYPLRDLKQLQGLFFSRRAVLSKKAAKEAEAVVA